MLTLRLTQHSEPQPGHYRVEIALEGDGLLRQTAEAFFQFTLSGQDQEDVRWYLEDYLQHPFEPAPTIAARVERRLAEIGTELFRALFQANDDARDLWAMLRTRLNETRVEVVTGVQEATAIPWELLRDPKTDAPLAVRARAFVHAQPQAAQPPQPPRAGAGPIRILLVICRPGGRQDVPFRSVASRIVKGLDENARKAFQLDVLRPPTYEQLSRVLQRAKQAGQPYHVVHFDGHGAFLDMAELFAKWEGRPEDEFMRALAELVRLDDRERFSPQAIYPQTPRPGKRGYLAFENPDSTENLRLVDGPELGKLLAGAGVPLLVLNACRSAHAEAPGSPLAVGQVDNLPHDVHAQVRAFGSLAQEVMDAGVTGVVAMRHNVYVVTAAQFVADLYASLAQGQTLGEAATLGRKQLYANPLRAIAYDPRPLQDWSVPVVYEAGPVRLFPRPGRGQASPLHMPLAAGDATPRRGALDPSLPPQPDAGFFGRDETLLALDRAFDSQQVVLLHAYAGSGKTATAAEFARWYALTGGVDGPVLFTSFEQYRPLPRVLDQIERFFGPALEAIGVHWLALDDRARREVALQVLKHAPVLWIWDNVEPVAGFPAGTSSAWSPEEQRELVNFLRDARGTRARFLLTSRRDERDWLAGLPLRLTLPPMPMQERVQLARALAEKHGRKLGDVEDWRPLLGFTQGNPLTITVVVGQALREGLRTRDQIEAFVDRLRAGEAVFEDEVSEGRTKSLAASLSYGFEHAFDEDERRVLALLHLFQGFVHVGTLQAMGDPEIGNLAEVRGLTREAGMALLDRAAEVGLLTAYGGGQYAIHPALPWYFKSLFERYYPSVPEGEGPRVRASRAFAETLGSFGTHCHGQYEHGNRRYAINELAKDETNLLRARQLALASGWWDACIGTMCGLDVLYKHTGRWAEWAQMVNEIMPDFVDLDTDGPLPGREEGWEFVIEQRIELAFEARQWAEAERLAHVCLEWRRQRAASALATPPDALDSAQRNVIRSLAVALEHLGCIMRDQGKPDCVAFYQEAIFLSQRIGDHSSEANTTLHLGHAYKNIPSVRDLAEAERCYRRSLEMQDQDEAHRRAECLAQIGAVALQRFNDARAAKRPVEELLGHLNDSAQFYHQALDLLPPSAVKDLAIAHNALGVIYGAVGDIDRALLHWREAIRCGDAGGSLYEAARARHNVAVALLNAGRLVDALQYAQAALRIYQTYGDPAAPEIQSTQQLIVGIEQAMHKT